SAQPPLTAVKPLPPAPLPPGGDEPDAQIVDRPVALHAALFDDVELPPVEGDDELTDVRRHLRAGRTEAARDTLAPLVAARPRDGAVRALAHVAAALGTSGPPEQARAELEQALVEDPNCAEAAALLDGLEDMQAAQRHSLLAPILSETAGA